MGFFSKFKFIKRGQITPFALGIGAGLLLAPTIPFTEGGVMPLGENISALTVHTGNRPILGKLPSYLTVNYLGNILAPQDDPIISTSNAMAEVKRVMGRSVTPGIYLKVDSYSLAAEYGLKSRDVIYDISLNTFISPQDRRAPKKVSKVCLEKREGVSLTAKYNMLDVCGGDISILRDGENIKLKLPVHGVDGVYHRLLGDISYLDVPFSLRHTTGSSAGLAIFLYLMDKEGEGDLFNGKRVVATGTIDGRGYISSISGLPYKAKAAADSKADIIFVPEGQSSEFPLYEGMVVHEIGDPLEAVYILCNYGSKDKICSKLKSGFLGRG